MFDCCGARHTCLEQASLMMFAHDALMLNDGPFDTAAQLNAVSLLSTFHQCVLCRMYIRILIVVFFNLLAYL